MEKQENQETGKKKVGKFQMTDIYRNQN
jgi:hypothetical protein